MICKKGNAIHVVKKEEFMAERYVHSMDISYAKYVTINVEAHNARYAEDHQS